MSENINDRKIVFETGNALDKILDVESTQPRSILIASTNDR